MCLTPELISFIRTNDTEALVGNLLISLKDGTLFQTTTTMTTTTYVLYVHRNDGSKPLEYKASHDNGGTNFGL